MASTSTPCIIGSYGDTGATGAKGEKGDTGGTGATGNGISSITEYYAVSVSNTTAPTSWSTTPPTMTATNKYLWNYEVIKYTDGTSKETSKRVIGAYGDKGATGATGKGVKSAATTYQASNSGTTVPTGTWSTSIPSVSAGQYLWTRTITTYTDDTTSTSYSVGYKGSNGTNGTNGTSVTVKSTATTYQASVSGTTVPTGTWSTSIPSVSKGQYLWTRVVVTYSDGKTATSYSVGYQGTNGTNGTSPTVSGTKIEYQQSTSGTTTPTGTWSTTPPTATAGQYMWTRTTVTYSDGKTAVSYAVGKNGTNGSTGAAGRGIQSTVVTYQAAASGTAVPTGTWVSSPPATTADKPYMWTKTVYTYTDSTTSTSYSIGATPEGIEIGGRNLARKTSDAWSSWWIPINKLNVTLPGIYIYPGDNKAGDVFTVSFDIEVMKFTAASGNFNLFLQGSVDDKWTSNPFTNGYNNNYGNLKNKALQGDFVEHVTYTVTILEAIAGCQKVEFSARCDYSDGTGKIRFKNIKVEKGNKATDWTPAPEDVDSAIDSAQNTADSAQSSANAAQSTANNAQSTANDAKKKIEFIVASGSSSSSLTLTNAAIAAITKQFKVTGSDGSTTIIEGGKLKVDDLSAISGKFTGSVVASSFKYSEKFGNGTIFFAVEDMHFNFGYKDSDGTFVTGLSVDTSETNISGSRITLDSTINEGVGIFIEDQIWLNGTTTVQVLTVDYNMSVGGSLELSNNTWNAVGDDVYIGDHNKGGCLCIKSAFSNYNPGIVFYDSSNNEKGAIRSDSSGNLVTSNILTSKIIGVGSQRIYEGENDAAYWWGSVLNNLVIQSWYGISFTTNCPGQTYTGKTAICINCRDGSLRAGGDISGATGLELRGGWFDLKIGETMKASIYVNASGNNLTLRSNSGQIDLLASNQICCVNYNWNAWVQIKAKAFNVQSSIRYKTNVQNMTEERAKLLLTMRPVSYDYAVMGCEKDQLGLIAEEVDEIDRYAVAYDEYHRPDSLDYSRFVPQLIKLCQLQQKEIDNLKTELSKLTS